MSLVNDLKRGRARIKRGWCQQASARDRDGMGVGADDRHAAAWCAAGAVYYDDAALTALARALRVPSGLAYGEEVVAYNDRERRRRADVLRLYDRAIAVAKKRARPGPTP